MSGRFGVFNPLQKWKAGEFPADAIVFVSLNEWTTSGEVITISSSLATESEIDFAVDRLKEDLETARRNAKRILNAQREKIRSTKGA